MPHGTHDAVPDTRNDHVQIYINGILSPRNEAKISVFDSGYLVGDGVWEGIRLHDGVLVFLDEHLVFHHKDNQGYRRANFVRACVKSKHQSIVAC